MLTKPKTAIVSIAYLFQVLCQNVLICNKLYQLKETLHHGDLSRLGLRLRRLWLKSVQKVGIYQNRLRGG